MTGGQVQLRDLVCNATMLAQLVTMEGGEAAVNDLQNQLCGLPDEVLQEAERLLLSQLDMTKILTVAISSPWLSARLL